jgi:hypothetical protein
MKPFACIVLLYPKALTSRGYFLGIGRYFILEFIVSGNSSIFLARCLEDVLRHIS